MLFLKLAPRFASVRVQKADGEGQPRPPAERSTDSPRPPPGRRLPREPSASCSLPPGAAERLGVTLCPAAEQLGSDCCPSLSVTSQPSDMTSRESPRATVPARSLPRGCHRLVREPRGCGPGSAGTARASGARSPLPSIREGLPPPPRVGDAGQGMGDDLPRKKVSLPCHLPRSPAFDSCQHGWGHHRKLNGEQGHLRGTSESGRAPFAAPAVIWISRNPNVTLKRPLDPTQPIPLRTAGGQRRAP